MRVRITYKKGLPLRFTSALDIQQIWERSFRRSGFKVQYSQGFHPQPKIQLGFPLPLGFISDDESVDVWMEDLNLLPDTAAALQSVTPAGIEISNIETISLSEKPYITSIAETEYAVYFWNKNISSEILEAKVSLIINSKDLIREKRNGKKYDLRPLILELQVVSDEIQTFIRMKLVTRQDKMGRPDEVLKAMGFNLSDFLVIKKRSFLCKS